MLQQHLNLKWIIYHHFLLILLPLVGICLSICPLFLIKMTSAQKTCLPIRASANENVLARKPFFQKITCRGKRASTYVRPCDIKHFYLPYPYQSTSYIHFISIWKVRLNCHGRSSSRNKCKKKLPLQSRYFYTVSQFMND